MKVAQILTPKLSEKEIKWDGRPTIGWLLENNFVRLYYGTNSKNTQKIIKDGIFPGNDGYVVCSAEPNTALLHSTLRTLFERAEKGFSMENDQVVFVIDLPKSYVKNLSEVDEKLQSKDLYEDWGKSDVEFYALVDIKVPKMIPANYIKGFMVKNEC